jgi:hypothetical protein
MLKKTLVNVILKKVNSWKNKPYNWLNDLYDWNEEIGWPWDDTAGDYF